MTTGKTIALTILGFPDGSDGKVSAHNEGELGLIPGLGRSPGEGNSNPLQYSCLENSMDGGAWWATVCGFAKSRRRLSDFTFTSLTFTLTRWTFVDKVMSLLFNMLPRLVYLDLPMKIV